MHADSKKNPKNNPHPKDNPHTEDQQRQALGTFKLNTLFSDDTRYHPYQLSDGSILYFTRQEDSPFLRIRIAGDLKLPEALACDWTDWLTAHKAVSSWLEGQGIAMKLIPRTREELMDISHFWQDQPEDLKIFKAD